MSTFSIRPIDKLLQPKASPSRNLAAPSMQAFLQRAFGPLYLKGFGWALVATALWIYALTLLIGRLAELAFFSLASCAMLSAMVMSKRSRSYAVTGMLEGLAGTDTLCQLSTQLTSQHRTPTRGLPCA